MVFFANKLRHDPRFANPTIVAVTDRTDLDDQLQKTFSATHLCALLPPSARDLWRQGKSARAAEGARRWHRVHDDPEVRASQRRDHAGGDKRQNVVVMADEAHRSQYAAYAQNITRALPERDQDRLHRHPRGRRRPLDASGVR